MLLKTFGPGEASPEIEAVYKSFMDMVGMVPPPFLAYSASQGIQSIQAEMINYYRERSNLSPMLTTLIRYLTAVALEMEPCVDFNARVLKVHGLSEEQVNNIRVNPASAPLGEKDGWLLAFVVKAVQAPDSVSKGYFDKLRDLGWTDTDIFDALHISCMMVGMERMMKALKLE